MAYKIPITKEKFMEYVVPKSEEEVRKDESELLKKKVDFYMDQLKKYDGKTFGEIANDKYAGEKLAFDTRTDEELSQMAKDYSDGIKEQKEAKLMGETESKKNAYIEKGNEEKRKTEEKIKNIYEDYESDIKDSKNNAIRKGIGRSSIIENLLKQQKSVYDNSVADVKNTESQKLEAINQEIQRLEDEIQKSIKAYDMEAAYNYNEKLSELKQERNEVNEKVAEYNAKVDKKIVDYANELEKTADGQAIKDYIFERSGKYVIEGRKALMAYITSLPLEQAYEELENGEWDYYMGKGTVDYVKRYLKDKTA